MTRDEKMARDLDRLSFHVARFQREISRWRENAETVGAHVHAILYERVGDELADAVGHLDAAGVLMDPAQTNAERFAEESQ
jgi:hypothetical protein